MIIIQPFASRTTDPRAPIPSSKLLGYYHSSALRTDNYTFWAKPLALFLLSPMHARPVLRVKESAVEHGIGAHLGILFSRANLIVDLEDDFRRHPTTAESLIFVELRLLRLRSVFPGRAQHPDKVKIFLIDPELRRMQIGSIRKIFTL